MWEGQFVRYVNGPVVLTYEAGERTDLTPFKNFVQKTISESAKKAEQKPRGDEKTSASG